VSFLIDGPHYLTVLAHGRRDLLALLYGAGRVVSEKPDPLGTRFRVKLDDTNWGVLQKELSSDR
jgi:hypothetical protein